MKNLSKSYYINIIVFLLSIIIMLGILYEIQYLYPPTNITIYRIIVIILSLNILICIYLINKYIDIAYYIRGVKYDNQNKLNWEISRTK